MTKKVKLSDYLIDFLVGIGVRDVFLVSGGGNIHIVDSVGRNKKINFICNHHEQASATAAESYARITGNLGVCTVTTGPGGTNAITGCAGAWVDSVPVLFISGQVRQDHMAKGLKVRQLGDQETPMVDIVEPVTKYAVTVMDPTKIKYHLQKAVYMAKNGRPGPVWIELPLDIQSAIIDENNLISFDTAELKPLFQTDKKFLKKLVARVIMGLSKSSRPVIYAGNGIRLAGASEKFLELVNLLKIPVLTSYAGYDLISSRHPYFFGRAHTFGQRAANFIIQNSDLILVIGARLDVRTIGINYRTFGREAFKIMVDIDLAEIKKPTLSIDLPINYDAKDFINEMISQLMRQPLKLNISDWIEYGRNLNKKYPQVLRQYWQEKKYVNPYCFIETVGKYMKPGELIVLSDGVGPLNCMYQAFFVKVRQRIILNNGFAQTGYGLPAAIGVCFTSRGKRVICFEGDGSIQFNIHELQVVKHHNLPIKIFVYSNDGYLSVRNSQDNFFEGRHVASSANSGLSCPDIVKVARAFGLPAIRIHNHGDMEGKIKQVLKFDGPMICDINMVRTFKLTPKLMIKRNPDGKFTAPPLEEMSPFLPEEELKENMLIPLWQRE